VKEEEKVVEEQPKEIEIPVPTINITSKTSKKKKN
jgi:hypothetical protein